MQHISSFDLSSDRQRFLSHLKQQQFILQHECNSFFPSSSMMPMGGMGMVMPMSMRIHTMMPHSYLQQQQQRFMAIQQQHFTQNMNGPVGMYSAATAVSRKMILESSSALEMGMKGGMQYGSSNDPTMMGGVGVSMPATSTETECLNSGMNVRETRCVSPFGGSKPARSCSEDSDSGFESDDCSTSILNATCHTPMKKAMMIKALSETKFEDEPQHRAGVKRSCSQITSSDSMISKPTKGTEKSIESKSSSNSSGFIPEIDQPKRRRTAYNLFFQHERARLLILSEEGKNTEDHPPRNLTLEEVRDLIENNPYFTDRSKRRHRKSHGKVSFMGLVKSVSSSWKNVDKQTKSAFEALAKEDQVRYRKEWKDYKLKCRKMKREVMQQQKKTAETKEEKAVKRVKTIHAVSKEESKQATREKILKKALSMTSSDANRCSKGTRSNDSNMADPQHDEIMHMLSSKIADHETHDHDDGQLVDLALELDSEFAMGLDGFAMV